MNRLVMGVEKGRERWREDAGT